MVRIGIIGSGGIASQHAGHITEIRGAKIVANADVDSKKAAAFSETFHTEGHTTDFRDVLADRLIDVVMICVPTHVHAEVVVAAAKAGKAIFCEKPLACTLADADRMIKAADKAGVPMLVGMVRRYDNHWGRMRRLVQDGVLGRPVIWRHPEAGPGPVTPWYCMKHQGMGPLMDGAVHDYDFACWTFGPAEYAMASLQRWRDHTDGFDTGNAIVHFASGDEMMMSWSWGMAKGTRGFGSFDLIGPKGGLSLRCPPELLPKDFDRAKRGALLVSAAGGQKPAFFKKNNMFLDQMKHMVRVGAGKEAPRVDGREGRKGLEMALAIFAAHRAKRAVRIPPPVRPRCRRSR